MPRATSLAKSTHGTYCAIYGTKVNHETWTKRALASVRVFLFPLCHAQSAFAGRYLARRSMIIVDGSRNEKWKKKRTIWIYACLNSGKIADTADPSLAWIIWVQLWYHSKFWSEISMSSSGFSNILPDLSDLHSRMSSCWNSTSRLQYHLFFNGNIVSIGFIQIQ